MLSILIPVYQRDVRKLLQELKHQCRELGLKFEIRCIDDHSEEKIRQINRDWVNENASVDVFYSELPSNIGRSKIRNLLAQEARYEWLWFLDCDADISENPSLVKKFLEAKKENSLISGGRIYHPYPPEDHDQMLHWSWCSQREIFDPALRMKDPVNHFLSNNFIIPKNILNEVSFESHLDGYGYEDTFFAAELKNKGYQIIHIYNPVIHDGLESAAVFIEKIKESLKNLIRLKEICKQKQIPFPVRSKLIRAYRFFSLPIISHFSRWIFRKRLNPLEIALIKSPKQALWKLDLFRLAYLISISDES